MLTLLCNVSFCHHHWASQPTGTIMSENAHAETQEAEKWRQRSRHFLFGSALFLLLVTCLLIGWQINKGLRQKAAREELNRWGVRLRYPHEQYTATTKPATFTTRQLIKLAVYVDPDFLFPVVEMRTPYLESRALKSGTPFAPREILESLPALPQLESLDLNFSLVTNEDLTQLSHLQHLNSLDLSASKLHEGPLPGIEKLNLKSLGLSRTRVDDESLASFQAMDSLEWLNLTRTKVTDKGLKHLENLSNLRKLILRRTLVTREGYQKFADAHPKIDVSWEPLKPDSRISRPKLDSATSQPPTTSSTFSPFATPEPLKSNGIPDYK